MVDGKPPNHNHYHHHPLYSLLVVAVRADSLSPPQKNIHFSDHATGTDKECNSSHCVTAVFMTVKEIIPN